MKGLNKKMNEDYWKDIPMARRDNIWISILGAICYLFIASYLFKDFTGFSTGITYIKFSIGILAIILMLFFLYDILTRFGNGDKTWLHLI